MKKCKGVINITECNNKATWKAIGYSAQFGVPSTDYVCDNCKEIMIQNFTPKIMPYNQFKLTFVKLE